MNEALFAGFLKDIMGMDPESVGMPTIERAVRQRAAESGAATLEAYWQRLQDSAPERQALFEAVVVLETWFFRDKDAFETLGRIARQPPFLESNTPLRLLSLPCATGEEPFSMVMALTLAGVPPGRFQIDAVDLSERALETARRARYSRNSFRGADLAYRDRFFVGEGGAFQLRPEVLAPVRFAHGNLLEADFMAGAAPYDVVFCRNVLIYFDRPTQERAIALLRRLLTPRGVLFVGPSESAVVTSHGFESARIPHAFAFFKAAPKPVAVTDAPARKSAPIKKPPAPVAVPPILRIPAPAPPAPASQSPLQNARQPADLGRLDAAAEACRAALEKNGPSAEAFYLLGLVRGAAGHAGEAAGHYRKALYLEPTHSEALLHLALLLEAQGNTSGAQLLRNRARRLPTPLPS